MEKAKRQFVVAAFFVFIGLVMGATLANCQELVIKGGIHPPLGVDTKGLDPFNPRGLNKARAMFALAAPGDIAPVVIPNVPSRIAWVMHGCGPTAVAALLRYWDINGYPDLLPGASFDETPEEVTVIASPEHYNEYALPLDTYAEILDDYSSLFPPEQRHADNCLNDYMLTSRSYNLLPYGATYWSWLRDGMMLYVEAVAPQYTATAVNKWEFGETGDLTFENFMDEINVGRPTIAFVDSDGEGLPDHAVIVVGYAITDGVPMYACYTGWDHDLHWYRYERLPMAGGYGDPFRVLGMTFAQMSIDAPPSFCGDTFCNGSETCNTCAIDCEECPPVLLFEDHFGRALLGPDWRRTAGKFAVAAAVTAKLKIGNNAASVVKPEVSAFTAGIVEAKVRLVAAGTKPANAVLRFGGNAISLRLVNGQGRLSLAVGGRTVKVVNVPVRLGRWYALMADVVLDGTVSVYYGGALKITHATTPTTGSVGISANGAVSSFDDIRVWKR